MSNNVSMRRLGDYIRQVDVRNRDLAVTNLKGLSIEKVFIESIANTIGTDLRGYKIVKPRQFAYVPVTSRNGEKITVALYDGENDCIISQAYTAFEIIDEAELLPEYLMMWFRRPEFDRYARFHSHGSARETFDWDEMCNVELPVPPIEEQREIVARHKAIEHKIDVNRRLIAKLEETARTIYRHTFVEDIDPENLPDGWRMGTLSEVAEYSYGKLPEKGKFVAKGYPLISGHEIKKYYKDFSHPQFSLIFIARGEASGEVKLSLEPCFVSNLSIYACTAQGFNFYLYFHLLTLDTSTLRTGSAQPQVTIDSINSFEITIPPKNLIDNFEHFVKPIFERISNLNKENRLLLNSAL